MLLFIAIASGLILTTIVIASIRIPVLDDEDE
jgi:hypothetical protein